MIFGCEVIYEPQLGLLDCLASHGTCWLADGGRLPAAEFIQLATVDSYKVLVTDANKQPLTSLQRRKFQLLQLQRKP
ncbi:hypothetical protein MNBD_PLANCTO02-1062 [hydrothermal vent metagenome]|uniref:Uncharacterized protein n=1 Tax=hydrothermal vent metagenome TaxID=652676 RepID=A0A3B1DBW7_9ZZZZ